MPVNAGSRMNPRRAGNDSIGAPGGAGISISSVGNLRRMRGGRLNDSGASIAGASVELVSLTVIVAGEETPEAASSGV